MFFHQLAQVTAWIADHHKSIDACNAEFQACLADGDSAQAVVVQLNSCLLYSLCPTTRGGHKRPNRDPQAMLKEPV